MQNTGKTDSRQPDALQPENAQGATVRDWLAEIERAVESGEDDIRREYTNIGGENGLELFV